MKAFSFLDSAGHSKKKRPFPKFLDKRDFSALNAKKVFLSQDSPLVFSLFLKARKKKIGLFVS